MRSADWKQTNSEAKRSNTILIELDRELKHKPDLKIPKINYELKTSHKTQSIGTTTPNLQHFAAHIQGERACPSPLCIKPLCWFFTSACCRCGHPGTFTS